MLYTPALKLIGLRGHVTVDAENRPQLSAGIVHVSYFI
jgi:hypothetical protein